ncbi:MAG TPA: pyridoxal-phosphate dependent enzyme [Candidatus Thermoplasmatota archaeon]|nr:pyridoxal-phosphate dependent enzyme [Candidatus Thermoplasmatota archaeon]
MLDAGSTLFSRARNIESVLGVRTIHLKFEGSNPTGTQKDRIARHCYDAAHEKGFDTITVATCGNFGASMAWACSHNGIRPAVFVPADYHTPRIVEMERLGARIIRVPGDYEDAVAASRDAAKAHGWYDANPGSAEQWEISRLGYGRIAHEIVADLGRFPDTVAVAVGNGTTLAAVYDGFREVARASDGRYGRLPRMIAASTPRGNPIIKSWKLGLKECVDLRPDELKETEVNEPLVNWHAFDGQRALDAIHDSGGFAVYATDTDMRRLTALTRNLEGISVMTASTAALVGIEKGVKDGLLGEGVHVAVLTGRHVEKPRGARVQARAPKPDIDRSQAHPVS